jgi:hypothetical protein
MGTNIVLADMNCNRESKKDCQLIRQYIENSWNSDIDIIFLEQLSSTKISFRRFCDTFYNLGTQKDENIDLCRKWWECPYEKWQYHTGQCIDIKWILYTEWDCSDGSDEENLFAFSHTITHNRPCISLEQLGDGRVDCIGGIDERNTIQHCFLPTTLGRDFMCATSRTCIDEFDICKYQCPVLSDNFVMCNYHTKSLSYFESYDVTCLDGQWKKNVKSNRVHDCFYGEDEYMCDRSQVIIRDMRKNLYRKKKELEVKQSKQKLRLPRLGVRVRIKRRPSPTLKLTAQ